MSFSPDSFNRKMAIMGLTVKAGMVDLSHLENVYIRNADKENAQQWCQERFGDEWIWSSPIHSSWSRFFFKHEQDALAFKLTFLPTQTA